MGGALSGSDLLAFNHHLSALATAGLPLERGLWLAASEARSRRVREAIEALAKDLDAGVPLAEAFDRHRVNFPPVYARLMEAGLRSNNLPALLLSLARHEETIARLRSIIWRSVSYPLTVLAGLMMVATVISVFVLPQMQSTHVQIEKMVRDYNLSTMRSWSRRPPIGGMPVVTTAVMVVGPYLPVVAGLVVAGMLAVPGMTVVARLRRKDGAVSDLVTSRLPLVGPAIRHAALARFMDGMAVCVAAGLDLPRALRTAGELVGYPRLMGDAEAMAGAIERGEKVGAVSGSLRFVPVTLADTLDAASANTSMAETLEALAQLHRQQAELRAQRVPLVLVPVAVVVIGLLVAVLMAAVISPMALVMQMISY
jgi:type II secretory pathway component PulF